MCVFDDKVRDLFLRSGFILCSYPISEQMICSADCMAKVTEKITFSQKPAKSENINDVQNGVHLDKEDTHLYVPICLWWMLNVFTQIPCHSATRFSLMWVSGVWVMPGNVKTNRTMRQIAR
jgi:hypothetical protein